MEENLYTEAVLVFVLMISTESCLFDRLINNMGVA